MLLMDSTDHWRNQDNACIHGRARMQQKAPEMVWAPPCRVIPGRVETLAAKTCALEICVHSQIAVTGPNMYT